MKARLAIVPLACILCISYRVCCQRRAASQETPAQITECEVSGCSPGGGGPDSPVWTLSGSMGVGRFGTGNQPLIIEHIDASSIAVRRVDQTGPVKGLNALYMGAIDGQRIIGTVIYYDPRHPNVPSTNVWNGILNGSLKSLTSAVTGVAPRYPFTLRECESNRCLQSGSSYPIVWTFRTNDGQGWLGDKPRPMIMEDLAPDFLLVRRIDGPALGGGSALYFGRITDGKHITGGVLYYGRDTAIPLRSDTWFGEIQKTFIAEEPMYEPAGPASPVTSTDIKVAAPSSIGNSLFLNDGCTRDLPNGTQDAEDAWIEGKKVQTFGWNEQTEINALMWFCKTAQMKTADTISRGRAEFEIGQLYLQGFILPPSSDGGVIRSQQVNPDPNTAISWFLKAEADGITNAMDRLALLYMAGPMIKGNLQPKNFSKSVSFLKEAAMHGDSWALVNLGLVNTKEGFSVTQQESNALTRAATNVALKKASNPCIAPNIMKLIVEETPERDVLAVQTQSGENRPDVSPLVFYGDSYVCVARLGPIKDEDADHQLWGPYFSGAPVTYWKYAVYKDPAGGGDIVVRFALRRMVSDYADTFGALVSAATGH